MLLWRWHRFDLDGDDLIQRHELRQAVVHLGLVPFGGDLDALADECLASLGAGSDGCVSWSSFKVGLAVHIYRMTSLPPVRALMQVSCPSLAMAAHRKTCMWCMT